MGSQTQSAYHLQILENLKERLIRCKETGETSDLEILSHLVLGENAVAGALPSSFRSSWKRVQDRRLPNSEAIVEYEGLLLRFLETPSSEPSILDSPTEDDRFGGSVGDTVKRLEHEVEAINHDKRLLDNSNRDYSYDFPTTRGRSISPTHDILSGFSSYRTSSPQRRRSPSPTNRSVASAPIHSGLYSPLNATGGLMRDLQEVLKEPYKSKFSKSGIDSGDYLTRAAYERYITKLEMDESTLVDEISKRNNVLDSLRSERDNLLSKEAQLQTRASVATSEAANLRSDLGKVQQRLRIAEEEVLHIRNERNRLHAELEQERAERTMATSERDRKASDFEALESRLTVVDEERRQLQRRCSDLEMAESAAKREVVSGELQRKSLLSEVQKYQQMSNVVTEERSRQAHQIQSLEEECHKLREENNRLKAQNLEQQRAAEVKEKVAKAEGVDLTKAELQPQLTKYQSQLGELRREKDSLLQTILSLEHRAKEAEVKRDDVTRELSDAKASANLLAKSSEDSKQSLSRTLDEVKDILERSRADNRKLQQEIQARDQGFEELKQQHDLLQAKVTKDYAHQVKAAQTEVDVSKKELAQCESILAEKKALLESMNSESQRLNQENTKLTKENTRLRKALGESPSVVRHNF